MTTQELEQLLLCAVAELRQASDKIDSLSEKWATSDQNYRHKKAVAYLQSEGTVQAREAQRDIACEAERRDAHLADALLSAARDRKRALETEISAYQTIAGIIKAEMGLAGRYE